MFKCSFFTDHFPNASKYLSNKPVFRAGFSALTMIGAIIDGIKLPTDLNSGLSLSVSTSSGLALMMYGVTWGALYGCKEQFRFQLELKMKRELQVLSVVNLIKIAIGAFFLIDALRNKDNPQIEGIVWGIGMGIGFISQGLISALIDLANYCIEQAKLKSDPASTSLLSQIVTTPTLTPTGPSVNKA